MKPVLAFILIIVIGYGGAHLHFYRYKLPLGTKYIFFAGSEYLFLGLLLAASPLAVFPVQIIDSLSPVINMGLGWIGLLFGLQFEGAKLRRIPLYYMGITLIQSLLVMFFCFAGLSLCNRFFNLGINRAGIMLLATITSLNSPTCLAFMQPHIKLSHGLSRFLYYIASLGSFVGLTAFAVYSAPHGQQHFFPACLTLLLYPLYAAFLILIFHLLIRFRIKNEELLVLTIGTVILSGGLADTSGLSPFFLNFLLGIGLINLPSLNHRAFAEILHRQEKPIYIVFLVLAGAMWQPQNTGGLLLFIYLACYLGAKVLGSGLATRLLRPDFPAPSFWGLALASQGGIGVAVAVDCLQRHPGAQEASLFNIILAAILLTQLTGPMSLQCGLARGKVQ